MVKVCSKDKDGERVRIRELQAEAQERQRQLQEKDRTIATKERQLQENDRTIATQLRQLKQLLEANEQVTTDFQHKYLESNKQIHDLEQRLVAKDQQIRELQQQTYDQPTAKLQVRGQSARKGPLCLHWRKCGIAARIMSRPSCVVDGNMAYFNIAHFVLSYDCEKQKWSFFHFYSFRLHYSLAVVSGLLTAIGGQSGLIGLVTNQLISLTGEGKWVERFPPMPTKRYGTAAVSSGKSLVVAGGGGWFYKPLQQMVEVMDTETLQWSTASSLPFALRYASATICQECIYLLGYNMSNEPRSVLACSMADLLQSCRPQSLGARLKSLNLQEVWHRVADLPACSCSCATLCGKLLAVGGDDDNSYTTAIHSPVQPRNQLLGGHQPHAHRTI